MSARLEAAQLRQRRDTLATPIERIAFDNDPANGSFAVRVMAMGAPDCPVCGDLVGCEFCPGDRRAS